MTPQNTAQTALPDHLFVSFAMSKRTLEADRRFPIKDTCKQIRYRVLWIIAAVVFMTLVVIGWTMIQRAQASNRRAVCAAHLSTLGFGLLRYSEEYGRFPSDITSPAGEPLLSWRVELLRVLDPKLYSRFDLTHAWNSDVNMTLLHRMPQWYTCPSDKEAESGLCDK